MFQKNKRRRIILLIFACLLVLLAAAIAWLNSLLTRYVESGAFQDAMGMETAKGLHLATAHYEPIRRTSLFTASSGAFGGSGGKKAILAISTSNVTARFNPWGVFLRRWQLDTVHIDSGKVEIHTYEPTPEPVPAKPWYAAFMPDRVYLKQVICDTADVTWQLRGRNSGFFGTHLLITPYGRDFEYRAIGGVMKMPLAPDLKLGAVHLLVTKQLLTLYNLDLASVESGGAIHLEGKAGLKEDKSIDAGMVFSSITVAPWLPESWRGHFDGIASGDMHWSGKNTKLETSSAHGALRIHDVRVSGLPFLQKLASITGRKSLETLRPGEFSLNVVWSYPKIEFKEIAIEEHGKFRVEGGFSIDRRALGGSIRLGVAREYLDWLPDAGDVFSRQEGDYLWVTIHLSGTLEKPQQDLSPRIMGMLEEHPGALLDFLFRQLGGDLGKLFDSEGQK